MNTNQILTKVAFTFLAAGHEASAALFTPHVEPMQEADALALIASIAANGDVTTLAYIVNAAILQISEPPSRSITITISKN